MPSLTVFLFEKRVPQKYRRGNAPPLRNHDSNHLLRVEDFVEFLFCQEA